MEVTRPGIKCEPQVQPAPRLWQHLTFNPLLQARDLTHPPQRQGWIFKLLHHNRNSELLFHNSLGIHFYSETFVHTFMKGLVIIIVWIWKFSLIGVCEFWEALFFFFFTQETKLIDDKLMWRTPSHLPPWCLFTLRKEQTFMFRDKLNYDKLHFKIGEK